MSVNKTAIKLCKSKDRRAQKELYEYLLPYMKAIASRYLKNNQFIYDVLQESFVSIFKNIETYDPEIASIKEWSARIVINKSINYNNRVLGVNQEEFDTTKHDFVEPVELDEERPPSKEELLKLLNEMPKGYFEVFNLSIIDGYDHQEISSILDISVELSRKKLSRARKWLKERTIRKNLIAIFVFLIMFF